MSNNNPVVHVWSQEYFHDGAYIVGNREGLETLRASIDRAISNGKTENDVFACDGEGYTLHVICSENIDNMAVPYIDEIAKEQRANAVYPWSQEIEK